MKARPIEARFWEKVDKLDVTACWLWKGAANSKGYGQILLNGKGLSGHSRVMGAAQRPPCPIASTSFTAAIPQLCVNPAHLFLGTHLDNMADMVAKGRWANGHIRKTHCKYGHPFDAENTLVHSYRPNTRRCRQCHKRWCAARKARRRAER